MGKSRYYQYYVEGLDEEKIINVLKTDMGLIIPGKVQKINVVQEVNNLEDELIRSCNIKQIKELTDSKSNSDYKHDLVVEKRLDDKLRFHQFDINKFWIKKPSNQYKLISNNAKEIKK